MRAAFGLVALLVVIGIIAMLWSVYHPADTVRQGQLIRPQIEQFSGRSPGGQTATGFFSHGEAAIDSFEIEPQYSQGGRLQALYVTQVTSGGAVDHYYGLQTDDVIVEFGAAGSLMAVRDFNDPDLVKAQIHDAYRTSQPIVVLRNGKRMILPQTADDAPTPAPAGSLQRQLDAIQRVPTH